MTSEDLLQHLQRDDGAVQQRISRRPGRGAGHGQRVSRRLNRRVVRIDPIAAACRQRCQQ